MAAVTRFPNLARIRQEATPDSPRVVQQLTKIRIDNKRLSELLEFEPPEHGRNVF